MDCGVNLNTGEELATAGLSSEEAPARDGLRGGLLWLAYFVPGLLVPRVLLGAAILALLALATEFLCILVLGLGVLLTGISIGAAGLIVWAQAVVWILLGYFCVLHDGLAEFEERHWTLFVILVFGPLAAFIVWLGFAAQA